MERAVGGSGVPELLEKITAAFDSHRESEEFRALDPDDDKQMEVVRKALDQARGESHGGVFERRPTPVHTHADAPLRLLFGARPERLLDQSLTTFRQVLKDSAFGEKLVGGARPEKGDHVFASIQSLNAGGRIDALDPEHYEVVTVDESTTPRPPRTSGGSTPPPER